MLDYTIFTLVTVIVSLALIWMKHKFSYWKNRKVPTPSLRLFLEHSKMGILQQNSYADRDLNMYRYFKDRNHMHGGTYFYHIPVYIPIDLNLIKHILQIDHQCFQDRGLYVNEKGDPLSAHLFSLGGEKWRTLRKKLTPTFTSGKMRMMFQTIQDCTSDLQKAMIGNIQPEVDVKNLMARFTTDVIGSVAFGIKCNSLENPKCQFREMAQTVFRTDFLAALKHSVLYAFPEVMQSLNVKILSPEASDFFLNIIKNTVDFREKNKVFRRDFMQLLIHLKNGGSRLTDAEDKNSTENMSITIDEVAAQAFIFFEAGYESSSNTMSFCLYELSCNLHVQERAREEIFRVLDKYGGVLTYDAVEEMKYLEQVLCETLRKYPPLSSLYRICTETYQLPGTDVVLEKGTRVLIPTYGIHHDPEYYLDPEKFDPDRFGADRRGAKLDCTFLPFGIGPRVCIGLRFGKLQTKVGLISLLRHFEFSLSESTTVPLEFDPESFTLSAKGKLWLKYKKIDDYSEMNR
ncbi:probable cytochrome P450 6a14 [Coccinella septempunctata]|uniref:probable cytochrome P450 6a14 n=1 Tax=Coccinella septempunctata TaxID=41139 RepID=UPI001D07C44B|nr:probable cytochrome P450 6a14 [Coccinella septempunctata]